MRRWVHQRFEDLAVTTPGAPPQRRDWILAGLLAVFVIVELVFGPDLQWPIVRAICAFVALAVLPYRRQYSLLAALAAFSTQFIAEIFEINAGIINSTTFGHTIAGLMLAYSLCRWSTLASVGIGIASILTMIAITEFRVEGTVAEAFLFVIPWAILALFALAMRYRARLIEQRNMAIRVGERNALARELHDSVAHHVSAIAVQAQAAQFVAQTNPEAAAQAMSDVEAIANATVDEMRRMVGILRSDEDHNRTVIATSLGELVEAGGEPTVTVTSQSSLEHLPIAVAAAIYRIAQESITNARRHSRDATFIDLEMSTSDTAVTLEVINDGVPTSRNRGGGFGLIGMNERVDALGGTIESGPRPVSGWRVHAVVPITRPPEVNQQ